VNLSLAVICMLVNFLKRRGELDILVLTKEMALYLGEPGTQFAMCSFSWMKFVL
jgi:hypothetical protein